MIFLDFFLSHLYLVVSCSVVFSFIYTALFEMSVVPRPQYADKYFYLYVQLHNAIRPVSIKNMDGKSLQYSQRPESVNSSVGIGR